MTTVINVPLANPKATSPDSVRRAILILNKLIEQLSADDLVLPQSVHTATSDEALTAGMACYMKTTGHLGLAKADSGATATVVGLVVEDYASGVSSTFVTAGKVSLSDWTSVIGSAALTPGTIYYLSKDTKGLLTATAPSTPGECVTVVGLAISTTLLDVRIENYVLL